MEKLLNDNINVSNAHQCLQHYLITKRFTRGKPYDQKAARDSKDSFLKVKTYVLGS